MRDSILQVCLLSHAHYGTCALMHTLYIHIIINKNVESAPHNDYSSSIHALCFLASLLHQVDMLKDGFIASKLSKLLYDVHTSTTNLTMHLLALPVVYSWITVSSFPFLSYSMTTVEQRSEVLLLSSSTSKHTHVTTSQNTTQNFPQTWEVSTVDSGVNTQSLSITVWF